MPKSLPSNRRPDAMELFTDRVNEQKILRQFLAPAQARKEETNLLVTCFYGVGGVGKTTLCRKGLELARTEFPENTTVTHTSFDDGRWTPQSGFAQVAIELCRVIQEQQIEVDLTAALLAIWSKAAAQQGGIEEKWQLALDAVDKAVETTADHFEMAGIPGLSLIVKGALYLRDSARRRDLRRRLEAVGLWPADTDGRVTQAGIEKLLPQALYHDVRVWLLRNPRRQFRLMLDGFERIQSREHRQDAQSGVCEWCGYFADPNQSDGRARFRVAVFGRDRLCWDELYDDPSWGAHWNQHVLGGLGENDARDFLRKAAEWRANHGQEDVAQALKEGQDAILDASDERIAGQRFFHPYSLDLAVEMFDRARGKKVDLGRTPSELQERFLRYLEPKEKRALMILAMAETFNSALFDWLVEQRLVEYARHSFHSALVAGHSYFLELPGAGGNWRLHRQMEGALHKAWQIADVQRQEGRQVLGHLLRYHAQVIGDKLEKDWGSPDVGAWNQGMEILVTQGPELGLLQTEEWTELLEERPWSIDHHLCLYPRVAFQERVLRGANQILAADHPDRLSAMNNLANSYGQAGRLEEALGMFEKVLRLRREKLGADHPDTLDSMNNLAISYRKAGRLEEALGMSEEVLRLRGEKLGADHPDRLSAMNNLANSYGQAGRLEEALGMREEVLRLSREKLGADHLDTLRAMHGLAISYSNTGRLEEALGIREEVLRLRREKLGADHPDTLSAMQGLAVSYSDTGRLEEALGMQEEVLRLMREKLGADHPDTLTAMNNLANSYRQAGRLEEALGMGEEVLRLRREKLGADHLDAWRAMHGLAISYRQAGRLEEALGMCEEVLRLMREKLGADHPHTMRAMGNLAYTLNARGRLPEAVSFLRRCAAESPAIHAGVRYILACYECLSGNLNEAKRLITEELATYPERKEQALSDEDLAAIRDYIAAL
jgi:tetratricopeptide (TPR) repeat protein